MSVRDEAAGAPPPADPWGDPLPPLAGAASGDAVSVRPVSAASSASLRVRTSGVRIPSSSWISVSRKREASQRMM